MNIALFNMFPIPIIIGWTFHMINIQSIGNWAYLWADVLLVIVTGILAIFTGLMAVWIVRTFVSQNNMNSATLCKTYYDDIYNNNRNIWAQIGINKDRYIQNNGKYEIVRAYKSHELTALLQNMEMISILIVKNVIKIDYAYEIFSTLYFPYFYDKQIQNKIRQINDGNSGTTYYNNYIKAAKLCDTYFKNNKKSILRNRMRL